jgi:hypothetical protein
MKIPSTYFLVPTSVVAMATAVAVVATVPQFAPSEYPYFVAIGACFVFWLLVVLALICCV